MSKVWDTLIGIQTLLENSFNTTGKEIFEPGMDRFNQPGWVNRVWSVGSTNNDDLTTTFDTIHESQELSDNTLLRFTLGLLSVGSD